MNAMIGIMLGAIMLYTLLDGFSLGVGILLPMLPKPANAMHTLLPFWDGHETWMILAVALLYGAFPGWYGWLLSYAYGPVMILAIALVLRGVSFELEHYDHPVLWKIVFFVSSVVASATEGFIAGWLINQWHTGPIVWVMASQMVALHAMLGALWLGGNTLKEQRVWIIACLMVGLCLPATTTMGIGLSALTWFISELCLTTAWRIVIACAPVGMWFVFVVRNMQPWPMVQHAQASLAVQQQLFYAACCFIPIILMYTVLSYRVLKRR
jgi:cytochrome bd ubiquinol oxidase subunit II